MTTMGAAVTAASKAVWPEVQRVLSNRQVSNIVRAAWPVIRDDTGRRGIGGRSVRKSAMEETIWCLARMGWLRHSDERDALNSLIEWHASWNGVTPDGNTAFDLADLALYQAASELPQIKSIKTGGTNG